MLVHLMELNLAVSVLSLFCGALGSGVLYHSSAMDKNPKLRNGTTGSMASGAKGRQMYKELMNRLFEDSDLVIPPNADDPSTTVNVSILMVLENLAYLDMKSQTLNIMAWFQIDWYDPAFSWDTDVYPVDMIVVNEKKVWRPVLAIANTLLPRDQIMKIELPVSIFSNGNVRWFPGDSFIMTCHMNLNFYPFDTQTCKIPVSQWSHQSHHFNCTQAKIRSSVTGNGEWTVVGLDFHYDLFQEPGYQFWVLVYTITLRRNRGFYVINLIFPIILVSTLNNVVFILPVHTGDKMSVSVTSFLTLIVFLTMINDSQAKNSDTVCYLSLYLTVQISLGALAIVQSAILVACHFRRSPNKDHHLEQAPLVKPAGSFDPHLDGDPPDFGALKEDNCSTTKEEWGQQHRDWDSLCATLDNQTHLGHTPDRTAKERGSRTIRRLTEAEVSGTKSTSRDWTVIAARIDNICFPVFVGLNLVSLLIFCILLLSA